MDAREQRPGFQSTRGRPPPSGWDAIVTLACTKVVARLGLCVRHPTKAGPPWAPQRREAGVDGGVEGVAAGERWPGHRGRKPSSTATSPTAGDRDLTGHHLPRGSCTCHVQGDVMITRCQQSSQQRVERKEISLLGENQQHQKVTPCPLPRSPSFYGPKDLKQLLVQGLGGLEKKTGPERGRRLP